MADKNIQLKTQGTNPDNLFPKTKASLVEGLSNVATSGSYSDLTSAIHKEYSSTTFIGPTSGASHAKCTWFLLTVRPDSWYKPWSVKFKIVTTCNANESYYSESYAEMHGCTTTINYSIFNTRANYAHYYLASSRLTKTGYDAGYYTAFGVDIYNALNYTTASYYRNFAIDYYSCEGCSVSVLDSPLMLDQLPGYISGAETNRYGIVQYNGVDAGLQETGDANTISQQYEALYGTIGKLDLCYSLIGLGSTGLIEAISRVNGGGEKNVASAYLDRGPVSDWASGKTYAVNDSVFYAGGGYYCKTAHTSSTTFDKTKWMPQRCFTDVGLVWQAGIRWYSSNTILVAGSNSTVSAYCNYPSLDLRYTDNILSNNENSTLTVRRGPIYLRGYIKNGLFYVCPTSVYYSGTRTTKGNYLRATTQTIPTQEETYTDATTNNQYPIVYWKIGVGYTGQTYDYRISLLFNQPLYWYHDGQFQIYDDGINQNDFSDYSAVSAITSTNIAAWNAKSDFSGSYNDLTDKPSVDASLNKESTNAIQNKAVKTALDVLSGNLDNKLEKSEADDTYAEIKHNHAQSDITGLETALNSKANNTSYTPIYDTTSGASGLVPAPIAERDENKVLTSDNGWASLTTAYLSGTLPVSKGGTGSTNASAAAKMLLNSINASSISSSGELSFICRNDVIAGVSQYNRYSMQSVWDDVYKSKCVSGVYNISGSEIYTGKPLRFFQSGAASVSISNSNGNYIGITIGVTCLEEGTMITMADNSKKPIELIRSGDIVLSMNPETKELTESVVLSARSTGTANDYNVMIFENGAKLYTFGRHRTYAEEAGYPIPVEEFKTCYHTPVEDGETTRFFKTMTHTRKDPTNHYDLLTSNNLYFANGILCGHHPGAKWRAIQDEIVSVPEEIKNYYYSEQELYADYKTRLLNDDYVNRTTSIELDLFEAKQRIQNNKQELEDSDYITIKHDEGLVSEEEWAVHKQTRSELRKAINTDQGLVSSLRKQLDAVKKEFGVSREKKRQMFNDCFENGSKFNDDLKAYFVNKKIQNEDNE